MRPTPHLARALGLLTLLWALAAQSAPPRVFAITDVRIVPAPGQLIDRGTVIMRDGFIEAVGDRAQVPADATVIQGEPGWTIYPAFIDAAATVGLDNEAAGGPPRPRRGAAETPPPGAPHELESVQAQVAVIDQFNAAHTSIGRHRELGFAVAQVLPGKGVFRGESAVVLLREAPVRELVLAAHQAQVVALEKSSFMARQYPSSSIGAVAAVRQTLLDARRQLTWSQRYDKDPAGLQHPDYRASDAALMAVASGERPVVFVALADLDPGRFAALAGEFGLRGVVVATGLGERLDGLLAGDLPILLPLTGPARPDLGDPEQLQDLTLRELQSAAQAPGIPLQLAEAGKTFAFVTAGLDSVREFQENLAAAVDAGLDRDLALAAMTTVPARLLGMSDIMGTLAPGKLANLLVVNGELFTAKPELRHLFVDGYHEEFEPPAVVGDPNAVVDPRGTWEIITRVMGQSAESTWTIRGATGNLSGSSESAQSGKRDFRRVDLAGNALTVVSESPRGAVDITVVIEGDRLSGETTMESPRGAVKMSLEGRRTAGPEEQML